MHSALSGPAAATLEPQSRLQYLPGIGPRRAEVFARLGLTTLEQLVRHYLDALGGRLPAPLPDAVRVGAGDEPELMPLAEALPRIHFPDDDAALEGARRRLAFEELFLLQTVLALRRRALGEAGRGLMTAGTGRLAAQASAVLPYALTAHQRRAIEEIVADMRREAPMHRMLLGDVGSGKTVVAFLSALHAIQHGLQVAFMAPTEILARQHGATLARLAAPAGAAVEVLTGATPAPERRRIAARLEAGGPLLLG